MSEHDEAGAALWWGIAALAIVLVLVLVVGILSIQGRVFLNQVEYDTRPYDPAVLAPEARRATEEWTSLEATRQQIINLEAELDAYEVAFGADRSTWPQGKPEEERQLRQHVLNAKSAYATACAQYEARWLNEWQAVVAPDNLPRTCPAL